MAGTRGATRHARPPGAALPTHVSLHVAAFNERARRVYERAGFRVVSSHVRSFERCGDVPFSTMVDSSDRGRSEA